jgi:hypothetical protein
MALVFCLARKACSVWLCGTVGASVISLANGGCASPPTQESLQLEAMSRLPDNWLALPESDWRLEMLPAVVSGHLAEVRGQMASERESAGYHFHQRYSEVTIAAAVEANRSADAAFIQAYEDRAVSFATVARYPTPELVNVADRSVDVERNIAVVENQNLRNLWSDLGRVFLLDQPSYLSPWNIVNTTGQP